MELKVPPVIVFAVTAYLQWLSRSKFPSISFDGTGAAWWLLKISLLCLGLATAAGAFINFRRVATTVDPRTPHRASTLVTTGVYRYTRNPMYVGAVLVLLAWAIHLANGMAFAVVAVSVGYMTWFQVIPEEKALSAKFGTAYEAYRASVRRWI